MEFKGLPEGFLVLRNLSPCLSCLASFLPPLVQPALCIVARVVLACSITDRLPGALLASGPPVLLSCAFCT